MWYAGGTELLRSFSTGCTIMKKVDTLFWFKFLARYYYVHYHFVINCVIISYLLNSNNTVKYMIKRQET